MIIDTMDINSQEIHILLQDIYEYLKRNKESITLSASDRKLAEDLINRSKKQLQKIAIIKNERQDCYDAIDSKSGPLKSEVNEIPQNGTQRYVNMTKTVGVAPPPLPTKNIKLRLDKPLLAEDKCPYLDLQAKNVSREIKQGTLLIRRKVFNIIDRSSKVFGAVHENWLLMYWSNKRDKPFSALNLKQYEAKEDHSDPMMTTEIIDIGKEGLKKSDVKTASSFKVFQPNSPEKKVYSFVATTHKDMLQWVVNINRSHDRAVRGDKGEDQVYEICEESPCEEDDENIYNEIEIKPAAKCSAIAKPPAPVPQRLLRPSSSFSNSADNIYQELIGGAKHTSIVSLNSLDFSEHEEEDQSYYELATIQNEMTKESQHKGPKNGDINIVMPPASVLESDTNMDLEITPSRQPENVSSQPSNSSSQSDSPSSQPDNSCSQPNNSSSQPDNPCGLLDIIEVCVKSNQTVEIKPMLPEKPKISPYNPKTTISTSPRDVSLPSIRRHGVPAISKTPAFAKNVNVTPDTNTKSDFNIKHSSKLNNKIPEPLKPNQASSMVKIIRQRFANREFQFRNLGTFSRNSKLETFQASPTREDVSTDFDLTAPPFAESANYLKPIDSLDSQTNEVVDKDEKPMALCKPDVEDEGPSKKLKKTPLIPSKTKKINRKLQF